MVAAGAWFGDKLLGPSAESLGEQLKAYLNDRLAKIFQRTQLVAPDGEVRPLPAGLAMRLIVDASFSADDPTLTDWWASLITDAAVQASNKHAAFSDMMAMIGPEEARCLDEFMKSFSIFKSDSVFKQLSNMSPIVELLLEEASLHWFGELPVTQNTLFQVRSNMMSGEVPWPLRPVSWAFPFKDDGGKVTRSNMSNPWYAKNLLNLSVLERVGALQTLKATISTFGAANAWVRAVAVTPIGLEFYRACTAYNEEQTN